MRPAKKPPEPLTFQFADDGSVPNNPTLPFVVYPRAIDLSGSSDPEALIETTFRRHGWGDSWRNGIFPYVHYHSMIHEGLAIARGRAKVRFGGNQGKELDLGPGDVAILPAGTGHQGLWVSPDLVVIGAYPKSGKYNLCRGSKSEHAKALTTIPKVPLPDTDPVYGKDGPLLRLWGGKRPVAAVNGYPYSFSPYRSRLMADWITFWDSDHAIYVNARHRDAHYRKIADDVAAYIPSPSAIVVDYGCGEALHADRVAASAGKLILCEAAPLVRAALTQRFGQNPKIEVRPPEEVARLPEHSVDLIVLHSVAQYMTPQEADALFSRFRKLLKPGGLFVLGDVIPSAIPAVTDALALLRFGLAHGFFFAAVSGLIRTALSDYWRLRQTLGLTRYDEGPMRAKLAAAGFEAKRTPRQHRP